MAFVFASIVSIFASLCMWGYKESVIGSFNRKYGNRINADWHWNKGRENYPDKINIAKLVTVTVFGLMYLFALLIQLRA